MHRTTFPKGHKKQYFVTRNMSVEYIAHARRIAGLRAAASLPGATIESVVLDALKLALPQLEVRAEEKRKK